MISWTEETLASPRLTEVFPPHPPPPHFGPLESSAGLYYYFFFLPIKFLSRFSMGHRFAVSGDRGDDERPLSEATAVAIAALKAPKAESAKTFVVARYALNHFC